MGGAGCGTAPDLGHKFEVWKTVNYGFVNIAWIKDQRVALSGWIFLENAERVSSGSRCDSRRVGGTFPLHEDIRGEDK
jgi:hypothetical protein